MTAVPYPADRPAPESAVPSQYPTHAPIPRCERGAGLASIAWPRVDDEFRALLPALTPDQRAGLEESILTEGVLSPLVIWEETGLLLDGHNRLEIALREGIDYGTRVVCLPSREAAFEWIFKHQRDRRNLTPDQLALVMGRHYNRTKLPKTEPGIPRAHRHHFDDDHGRTVDRLAADYGVGSATIERNGKFAAAVETLKAVDPDIEAKVVTGKGPTRKAVLAAAEAIAEPATAKVILSGMSSRAGGAAPARPAATNAAPSDGMRIARSAAGKLNEIRSDDTERAEAFSFMRRWLDAHEA